ncbi:MAG: PrsW family intramembrane metalloprotease [Bacteroidales bacterium]|nr:PrsW family intramembrane metalloprotease [Bacteroidales bacterium]MBR6875686.1 PrsW family intramembrane metalloprotease [Bacteroidales bacterium]
MSFVAALLPVVIYIVVVYVLDSFALISVKRLLVLVLCGMAAALVCFGLFQLTWLVIPESLSNYIDPVMEEAVKAIPLLILARRKKIAFFIDSVICGAAVGGGFSILENIFYLLMGDSLAMGTILFRGLEVALIHMGCSAIVAAALMFAVRLDGRRRARLEVKRRDVWMAVFLLLAAPALHVAHNALHFNPFIQFISVFGAMAFLLVWTYQYDGDMIHRWLDKGLDKQVDLFRSIQEGNLSQTKTGEFLLSVKDSFSPEVFFDVICYVKLNVELSIAAKSRFMLREAKLDLPLDEEQAKTILAQYEEYRLLEKRLGQSTRITIAPVVKFYPADRKALDDLLAECKVI